MESSALPLEILSMILMMLPTKIVVKCQRVCKAWRDMIRDPCFVKRHFQIWTSKGNGYVLHVPLDHAIDRAFRLLHDKTFDHVLDIQVPPELDLINFIVIGSCNGLLCIADTNSYGDLIYLCNPYIRRCTNVRVPDVNVVGGPSNHNDVNVALGFGYHDQTNDYKIVKIVFPREHEVIFVENATTDDSGSNFEVMRSTVEVYSMITKGWKTVEVRYFPWAMINIKSEVVVMDSIHWKVIYRGFHEDLIVILAFHMGSETFRQIGLPNYEVDGEDLIESLGIYKGNLALFLFHLVDQDPLHKRCYLWVMIEYCVESSWMKTHTIIVNPGIVAPFLSTKNDEIIYDDGNQNLILCDLDSKMTRMIGHVEEQGYLNIVTYKDSLVLIDG